VKNIWETHLFPPPPAGEVGALALGGGGFNRRILCLALPPPTLLRGRATHSRRGAFAPLWLKPLKGGGKL